MIIFGVPNVPMLIEVTQVIGLIITLYVTPSLFPWCVVCMEKNPKQGPHHCLNFISHLRKCQFCPGASSVRHCGAAFHLHPCTILFVSVSFWLHLSIRSVQLHIYLRKPTSHTHTIFSAWSLPLKDLKPPASFPKKIHKVKLGKAVASSSDRKCI